MPNITVYGEAAGSSLRVHWMLGELGLEYTTKSVALGKGEHKTPEFLAINPAGQIPVIDIDGMYLSESIAIVSYLAEKFKPELAGATPEIRAQALRWSIWTILNPQKHLLDLAFQVWRNQPDEAAAEGFKGNLEPQLAVLDAHLAKNKYIAGDTFTTGDVCVASPLTYAKISGYEYTAFPNIMRWMTEVLARPGLLKVTAPKA